MNWKKLSVILMVFCLALSFAGCKKQQKITILQTDLAANEVATDLIGHMAENEGIAVTMSQVNNQAKNGYAALLSHDVSILADSAQSLWMDLLEHEDPFAATDLDQLNEDLADQNLMFIPFKNISVSTVLVVRNDVAKKYDIHSLEGLSRISDKLILAAEPSFYTDANGSRLILDAYDTSFKKMDQIEKDQLGDALKDGKADVIAVSSLDASRYSDEGVVMEDRLSRISPSPYGYVVCMDAIKQIPRLEVLIKTLVDQLSRDAFDQMTVEAMGRPRHVEDITELWLKRQGLIRQ